MRVVDAGAIAVVDDNESIGQVIARDCMLDAFHAASPPSRKAVPTAPGYEEITPASSRRVTRHGI